MEGRTKRFRKKGTTLLGFDRQNLIRRFFGGSAGLSIAFLFLISFFLATQAILFFPKHHEHLKSYRKSGQEYVSHLTKEVAQHSQMAGLLNQAYYAELEAAFGDQRAFSEGFDSLIEELEDDGEEIIDAWAEAREESEELDEKDAQLLAEAKAAETAVKKQWSDFLAQKLTTLNRQEIDSYGRLTDQKWSLLLIAIREWDPVSGNVPEAVAQAKTEQKTGMAKFDVAKEAFIAAPATLKKMERTLVKQATEIKEAAILEETAKERKAALLEGSKKATHPKERARMKMEAEAIEIRKEFPYEQFVAAFENSKEPHRAAVTELKRQLEVAMGKLPSQFRSYTAREKIEQLKKLYSHYLKQLDKSVQKASNWRHDRRVGWIESSMLFFFGKDWITNSSWHDFYGLLPLFMGSFLISTVALLIAVPFSLAAAIYVNQLSTKFEEQTIKPILEMVGAIPSVVLGFFGIVVLGESLRELSQLAWLSWVPGFPMQERLNILNAGLLLALMALPTIFTLCEEAVNNVPRDFSSASFALGASKIQTIKRVVVPAAKSGILAAILLGFGRIIGETMVVLLVAGNQIQIPDLSLGVGVLTQPTHTMTGIIAQEMGEVTRGTLHYRALFLIGLVLFIISLTINFIAQKIIRRMSYD